MKGVWDLDYTSLLTNGCYKVPCICNCDEPSVIEFTIDTGAVRTIINSVDLHDLNVKRTGKTRKFKTASNESIVLEEIIINQFTIATIDLGECTLYVGNINLLGTDILKRVTLIQKANSGKLLIRSAANHNDKVDVQNDKCSINTATKLMSND